MILSFFVFLIISCSMLFGMTSFIIGMRSQVPNEAFNSNKSWINFQASAIKYDKVSNNDQDKQFVLNDKYKEEAVNLYEDATIAFRGNHQKLDKQNATNIVKDILNNNSGNLLSKNIKWKQYDQGLNVPAFQKYVFEKIKNYSFSSLLVICKIVPSKEFQKYNPIVSESGELPRIKDGVGYRDTLIKIVDDSKNDFITPDKGHYETNKYKNITNVVYSNIKTKEHDHLSKGQSVTFTVDQMTQSFTYGGVYAPQDHLVYTNNDTESVYYIMNYQPTDISDFTKIEKYQTTWFSFYYKQISGSKNFEQWAMDNVQNKFFTSDSSKPEFTTRYKTYYSLYNALFLLNIMIIIILLVLTIILSWFLIKEMINGMSSQLLFLKSMGYTNSEASLINTMGIAALLIIAIGFSLVGMLGVQFIFTNMIPNFMDILLSWHYIQPKTLILVFGLLAFLFVAYFISDYVLISKLDLKTNRLVKKSDFAFARTRSFFFKRNTNLGISFSFNVKNLYKMIVAFFIVFLMSILTFVSAQFINSINEDSKQINAFNNHQETFSYLNEDDYGNLKLNNDGSISEQVKYLSGYRNPDKEVKQMALGSISQGSYVMRSTIDKNPRRWIMFLPKNFSELEKQYDDAIKGMWPNANTDFSINFGAMYQQDQTNELSFDITTNKDANERLIVLKDNDYRINKLFNNKQYDDNNLPVVISENGSANLDWNKGDVINTSYINLANAKNSNDSKTDIAINMKIVDTTTKISDENLMYVRAKDFYNYLTKLNSNLKSPYIDFILNNKNYVNSYTGVGVPNTLNQFVIPMDLINDPDPTKLKNYDLFNMNKMKIVYLKLEAQQKKKMVQPLSYTLLIILILGIILMITFIIFMDMTIMSENDNIIFIMKALGYSRYYVLRRIITGYFLAIVIGFAIGIIVSYLLLTILDSAFVSVIYAHIAFYWNWPIIVLLLLFLFVISGITLAISSTKIHQRSLTKREE